MIYGPNLKWGHMEVLTFEKDYFAQFSNLNPEISNFLIQNGIPTEIDILDFSYLKSGHAAIEKYGEDVYFNVGFSSSCGSKVYIDNQRLFLFYVPEDNWRHVWYINSDLNSLLKVFVRYEEFNNSFTKVSSKAVYNWEFSDKMYKQFIEDVKKIDNSIFTTKFNSLWIVLFEEMKEFRNKDRVEFQASKVKSILSRIFKKGD